MSQQIVSEVMAAGGLTTAQAAERLSKVCGRKIHRTTAWRWKFKGLEFVRVAGTWVTSEAAIARFLERGTTPAPAPAAPTTPSAKKAAARRARATDRLIAAGC